MLDISRLQPDIVIAAGEAYGSGAHPSTALMIQALQGVIKAQPEIKYILDIGCGSGVLSIVTAKMLPEANIIASDTNIHAPEFTMHNAQINHVGSQVTAIRADGVQHDMIRSYAPYDLILCNILADVLISILPDIARCLKSQSIAILGGIRKQYEPLLHDALRFTSLSHITTIEQTEWLAMIVRNET